MRKESHVYIVKDSDQLPALTGSELIDTSRKHIREMYNPLNPTFYIAKLGYAGVYLFFLFLIQNIDCG